MEDSALDSILDQALEDFDAQDLADLVRKNESNSLSSSVTNTVNDAVNLEEKKKMQNLLNNMQDNSYGLTLQKTLTSLSSTSEGNDTVEDLFNQLAKQFEVDNKSTKMPTMGKDGVVGLEEGDREVVSTMQMIGSAQQGMEGFEPSKLEEVGENMMENMMKQFEALGEKEDYNDVIDGVMRQLLSKDLMYEPTQQICDRFPEWLAIHKKSLTPAEYNNYGKQYQAFQKILAVYDTEPDNFPRLMELMFDMQQYGQPPADIIKDLAPGLKFDENGMPIMPNMGAGILPDGMMPGGEGLPNLAELSENMAKGQCIIS